MVGKPIRCCRLSPEIFTDIKSGSTERMWVVACSVCGKYTDAYSVEMAVADWNLQFKKQNPIDVNYTRHLTHIYNLFNPSKPENLHLLQRRLREWNDSKKITRLRADIPRGTTRNSRNFTHVKHRDGPICQYCGVDMTGCEGEGIISVDHIISVCKGGGNEMSNLVVACMPCNMIAGGLAFESFGKKKEFILQQRKHKTPLYTT